MKSKYKKIPDLAHPSKNWVSRPYLLVTLYYGTNKRPVLSLVDSGADYCLFHSSVASELGIELKGGWLKEFGGIATGEPVKPICTQYKSRFKVLLKELRLKQA